MDPRDKQMIARKLRRQADRQRDIATSIANEYELDGLVPTKADVKYEVTIGIYAALSALAFDFEERL